MMSINKLGNYVVLNPFYLHHTIIRILYQRSSVQSTTSNPITYNVFFCTHCKLLGVIIEAVWNGGEALFSTVPKGVR